MPHDIPLRIQIERRLARESIDLRVLERRNQSLNSSIGTQSRHRKRTASIEKMPYIKVPVLSEEASNPALDAAIVKHDLAGCGIVSFTGLQGVLLDEVAEGDHWWEAVCELDEAHGGRQASETEEVGDCGGEDECDGPVDGDNAGPKDLAAAGQERGGVEKFHEDVVIENFDADVAI